MNVIFTCGGTGGHINPAIAVANIWKERHPDSNILFIGASGHMEEKLVPAAGYELRTFPTSGMSRKLNLDGVKRNIKAVSNVVSAVNGCKKIIREFKPDVIVGTGGYASFPALLAGKMLKVPTCVHEANAMPGLTTRMAAAWAERVLICFEESARHYKHPEKTQVVGMPVRREFIFTEKEAARKELGVDSRPLIVSTFGSQGARAMNLATAELMKLEQDEGYPYQHIHGVGSFGWEWMPEHVKSLGVDVAASGAIDMREYIYNMPTVMAAADIIISRAGASSCNEIAASGTPCILIPSPNVTDNHQEKNARAIAERGGAVLLLEKDCTAQALMEHIKAILTDRKRYSAMSTALRSACVLDSAERICAIMEELATKK
ncbi:MAG: undecaprenyldiphospho-muramoylpentapeptide beta-N-acetylglucosaminyltransferase [Oscillospiraceae bacterium]|nr:undecaprenyldiphospho-muramoylpentapeptide beta-N-acetylglucosaminyltransferase [Oscillospiraceae bacterium]